MSRLIESTLTGKISKALLESERLELEASHKCDNSLKEDSKPGYENAKKIADFMADFDLYGLRDSYPDEEDDFGRKGKLIVDIEKDPDAAKAYLIDIVDEELGTDEQQKDAKELLKLFGDEPMDEAEELEKGQEILNEENKDYTLEHADSNKISELEKGSAFTFEGLDTSDKNLNDLVSFLKDNTSLKTPVTLYTWSGKEFNEKYGLTGDNAYPDDLNFVSISLDSWSSMGNLPMLKMQIGARWLDDIVDNNARRERNVNECDNRIFESSAVESKENIEERIAELKLAIQDGVSDDEKEAMEKEIADLENKLNEYGRGRKHALEEAWSGTIKSGSALREKLHEVGEYPSKEECQDVLDALKACCEEAKTLTDDEYYQNGFQSIIDDIEMIYDDEDLSDSSVDWELDAFYDYCDGANLWVELTESAKPIKEAYDFHELEDQVKDAVYAAFEGSDFTVGEVSLGDNGLITFNVTAYGPEDEEGNTEMSREVELHVPEINYLDAVTNACADWMSEHNSPDNFYENAKPKKLKESDEYTQKVLDEFNKLMEEACKTYSYEEFIALCGQVRNSLDNYQFLQAKFIGEGAKTLKEDSYEEPFFLEIEDALLNAGFDVQRYSDTGMLTKNIGWAVSNSEGEVNLTCAGTYLDECDKTLDESEVTDGDSTFTMTFIPHDKKSYGDDYWEGSIGLSEVKNHLKGSPNGEIKFKVEKDDYGNIPKYTFIFDNKYLDQVRSSYNALKDIADVTLNESVSVVTSDGSTVDTNDAASVQSNNGEVIVTTNDTTVVINNTPDETATDLVADVPVEVPAEEPVEDTPVEEPIEEVPTEEPIEEPVDEPTDEVVEEADEPVDEPTTDDADVINASDVTIVKNQGNIYMIQLNKEDIYYVCEDFNAETNEGSNATMYTSKEEADKDYFNRVGLNLDNDVE